MTNHPSTQRYETTKSAILSDPSSSYWLKNAIRDLEQRDPVDASNDALALAKLFIGRTDELIPPSSAPDSSSIDETSF